MRGGKLVIEIESNTKKFDAQIEQTKSKLKELEELAEIMERHIDLGDNAKQLEKINVDIEKTKNSLTDLYRRADREKGKGFGFTDGIKNLKKFALGLIGIRGIYSMVRKASSAWLSQDTELAKKFQNFWVALGGVMQPILEALADIMYKLLGYLNVFVKAFTGGKVDLIANANAKAIKNQANAMKELKNQTYGFDELNIQQVNDSSGSSGSSFSGIPNIKLDPDVERFVTRVGEVLGDVYGWLKKIISWVNENMGTGGVIMLGIATVLGIQALPKFGGKGLLAVYAVALAIYDIFKLIGIIKEWKDVQEAADDVSKSLDVTRKSAEGAKNKILEQFDGKTYEQKRIGLDNLLTLTKGRIEDIGNKTEEWEKKTDFSIGGITRSLNGVGDDYKKLRDNAVLSTKEQIEALLELAEQGELTDDEFAQVTDIVKNYFDVMNTHNNKTMGLLKSDVDDARNYINRLNGLNPKVKVTVTNEDKTKEVKIKVALANTANKALDIVTALFGNSPAFSQMKNLLNISYSWGATGGLLNKCAVGSIINNPGRGVYLGNNTIGGEAGKEGLIPLTDPNAMSELGETIARYIPIHITNVTKLNGKTINKENNVISNDMEFMRNGGVA